MTHQNYLNRTYELAKLGGKNVGSNPNVGAVLVYNDTIIGEGYHEYEGGPHAEVNALNSVALKDKEKIPDARLYVSLEPCCHYGKTPPCTLLIIQNNIKEVHIGTEDPFSLVSGKGVALLREKDVEVFVYNDIQAKIIIRPFTTVLQEKRPFVTLKFAKSIDNFIGKKDHQVWLSNPSTKVHAHLLRSRNDAILIGTHTAIIDNPSLTTRAYPGESPVRLIIDKELAIPTTHHVMDGAVPTIIFNSISEKSSKNLTHIKVDDQDYLPFIYNYCLNHKFNRLLVEGGASLIKSIVQNGSWDQAYVYGTQKILNTGIKAPNIEGSLIEKIIVEDNIVSKILKTR